jgi:hypothetical protein
MPECATQATGSTGTSLIAQVSASVNANLISPKKKKKKKKIGKIDKVRRENPR